MTEQAPAQENIEISEVLDIITPPDAVSIELRQLVEVLLDDDPSLKLDTTNPANLARLKLNFIGWMHNLTNAPAMGNRLLELKPDIIIAEVVGDGHELRRQGELLDNLLLRNVPVRVKVAESPERIVKPVILDPPQHDRDIWFKMLMEAGLTPLFRKMDMSDEAASALGVDLRDIHAASSVTSGYKWYLRAPLDLLQEELIAATAKEAAVNKAREAYMQDDISRISANALNKYKKDEIRIAVLHGVSHTAVARHFQKMAGVDAKFEILGSSSPFIFPPATRLLREATLKDRIDTENVQLFLLDYLVVPNFMALARSRFPDIEYEKVHRIVGGIGNAAVQMFGDDIWSKWQGVYHRNRLTGNYTYKEKKVDALQSLLNRLATTALIALEESTLERMQELAAEAKTAPEPSVE